MVQVQSVFKCMLLILICKVFIFIREMGKNFKGTVMQIEKAPINDRLRVSKVS